MMARSVDVEAVSLREAMDVVEDFGDELLELLDVGDADARQFAPYPARRSQRHQLIQLRHELKQLEGLDSAWLVQSQRSGVSTEELGLRLECWEMNRRQRLLRRSAEQQNANLRQLLEAQRSDMRKLERLLQRALAVKQAIPRTLTMAPFLEDYKGPRVELPDQLFRLELLRVEMEHVFSSGMFAQNANRPGFKEVQVRDCTDRVEVVYGAIWDLPFDLEDVDAAMWGEMTRATQRERSTVWADLYSNDTVRVSRFIATPVDLNDPGVKHGQTATRRLPTTNSDEARMVSTVQISRFEQSGFRNLGSVDVWVNLRRLQSKFGPLTQIKWHRRVCLNPPQASGKVEWIQSLISGAFREQEERHLDWSIQVVENALLDRKRTKLLAV